MKRTITIFILFFWQLALGQNKVREINSFLHSFSKEIKLNGNILIAEKGKVIYKKSFGLSNELTKDKLNENSIFELASVSKQFTAMAIVILKEKGKLRYDDKVSKYIPALINYDSISIRNLLNHTSGLPDYSEIMDSVFDKNKIATNKDVIEIFAKVKPPLLFEPGSKWEYSNTGYALLASIIEKVSGMTYAEYLNNVIFRPLKMTNTFVHTRRYAPKKIDNYAYGYFYSDSLKKFVLPDYLEETKKVIWLDGIVGDGNVNSTIIDLFKWDRALSLDLLVSKESIEEMFTSSELGDGTKTDYGFGWFVEDNGVYGKIVKHAGGWPGYRTLIERHLQNDKTIIVLLNYVNNETTYIPIKIIRQLLYSIEPLKIIELKKEEKENLVGTYQNLKTRKVVRIVNENGKIYKQSEDGNKLELKPISKTKFLLAESEPDVFIEFIIKNNKVEKYIMTQPEEKIERELVKIK